MALVDKANALSPSTAISPLKGKRSPGRNRLSAHRWAGIGFA
jgi:hypothetical protein